MAADDVKAAKDIRDIIMSISDTYNVNPKSVSVK